MKYHDITIKILEDDYKMLFKMKKRERDNLIKKIFNAGYYIYFPNRNKEINNQQEVLSLIQSLKSDFINPDIGNKIDSLENSLGKLIGLSSNSCKKGEIAENILEELIKNRYGDIDFKNTSKIQHSGDAWLTFPDNGIVMLESKNYTNVVSREEIEKMERDMKEHNILWGLFISWNSCIQGKREFDFHIFSHKSKTYIIVMLSNLSKDTLRLDLGIQILRKLRKNFNDLSKFPWIISNIKEDLDEFDNIVNMNYTLMDSFEQAENNIKNSLSDFYKKLREYNFKLTAKSKEILDKINSTMCKSVKSLVVPNFDFLKKYKDKKIFMILSKFLDFLPKLSWILKENEFIEIIKSKNNKKINIGRLKIQNKKIIINITKLNIQFELKDDLKLLSDTLNAIKIVNQIIEL